MPETTQRNIIRSLTQILLFVWMVISFPQYSFSQTVVSPSGNSSTVNNVTVTSTVGEVMISTLSNSFNFYTQGFNQPIVSVLTNEELVLKFTVKKASCDGNDNGAVRVKVLNGKPPYTYNWHSLELTTDTITGLEVGEYVVTARDANGWTGTDTVKIESETGVDCILKVYNAFSPNNDGHNDTWVIEGIDLYIPNKVSIFSVTGNLVWQRSNYNNSEVVWKGDNRNGNPLPKGTYFYVIEADNRIKKDWVEIVK